jgi:predicted transposase YbfD/YdcC
MPNHPKLSLIEHFKGLPDPRVNRTKDHDLIDLLVIAVCTLRCAGESFNDMEDFGHAKHDWFKTFLTLRNGIPSHDTFNRLFAALDGKALRRALNADQGVSVKRPKAAATLAVLKTVEKDHGRIETRRYYQSAELEWFANRAKWEGLGSVGMVEAIREIGGQRTVERRYYLTSLPLGVEALARAVRGHWGVENNLHWVLDVCFREDQSRARAGFAAENLATLRRLALNLLRREKTKKRGIKGKQLNAGWDHACLLQLGRTLTPAP